MYIITKKVFEIKEIWATHLNQFKIIKNMLINGRNDNDKPTPPSLLKDMDIKLKPNLT